MQNVDTIVQIASDIGAALRTAEAFDRSYSEARKTQAADSEGQSIEFLIAEMRPHIEDRAYVLRDQLSLYEASSIEGATVQVLEAINLIDIMEGNFDKDYRTQRDFRTVMRLLWSAAGFLNGIAERKAEDIATAPYCSFNTSPWAKLARARGIAGEEVAI